MATLVPNSLTPQIFGDCRCSYPRDRNGAGSGGLGRGYPAGGTTEQYKKLHRIAIAENDLTKCMDFLKLYCEIELDRIGVTDPKDQPWISMHPALKSKCLLALQTAWNSSQHMTPAGRRFMNWSNAQTLEDKLCNSCWNTERNKVFRIIRAQVSQDPQLPVKNPAPAPLYPTPQWYTDEVAAENTRLAAVPAAAQAPVTAPPAAAPVPATSVSAALPATTPLIAAQPAPLAPNHGLQWANETLASLAPSLSGSVWEYTASDEEAYNLLG